MKKIFLSLALVLAMGLTVSAQSLFNYGPDSDANQPTRETMGLMLPSSHGEPGDQNGTDTPLGTGTAILLGLGAAYMITKKRKK